MDEPGARGVSIDQRNPHRYPMALHTSAVLRCPFLRILSNVKYLRIGYAAMGMSSKNNSHRSSSRSVKKLCRDIHQKHCYADDDGRQGQNAHDQMKRVRRLFPFVGCACSHDSKPSIIPAALGVIAAQSPQWIAHVLPPEIAAGSQRKAPAQAPHS